MQELNPTLSQEEELDTWQIQLLQQKNLLEDCQREKGHQSCMSCTLVMDCVLRDKYVQSVYESMSKGSTGGFEF